MLENFNFFSKTKRLRQIHYFYIVQYLIIVITIYIKKYKKYSHKRSVYVQLSVGPHFSCVNDSDMMQLALSDLFFVRQSSRQNLRENLFRKPVLFPVVLFPFPLLYLLLFIHRLHFLSLLHSFSVG